ncbi:MAG TPA: hypothetical protein VNI84_18840 [Pyrinomonadaceae bacterium]|nr:hypothetical protein [Pyrinomonadaceae bacterium]
MNYLKTLSGGLKFYLWDVWTTGARFYIYGGLLLIIIVAATLSRCNSNRTERKKEQLNTNITTGKIEANIANREIKRNEENTNKSQSNFNAVIDVDTGTRSTDFGAVRRKFCESHPNDSRCR